MPRQRRARRRTPRWCCRRRRPRCGRCRRRSRRPACNTARPGSARPGCRSWRWPPPSSARRSGACRRSAAPGSRRRPRRDRCCRPLPSNTRPHFASSIWKSAALISRLARRWRGSGPGTGRRSPAGSCGPTVARGLRPGVADRGRGCSRSRCAPGCRPGRCRRTRCWASWVQNFASARRRRRSPAAAQQRRRPAREPAMPGAHGRHRSLMFARPAGEVKCQTPSRHAGLTASHAVVTGTPGPAAKTAGRSGRRRRPARRGCPAR